jgi:hypothetical protein
MVAVLALCVRGGGEGAVDQGGAHWLSFGALACNPPAIRQQPL